jgi:hypothetical protein
LIFSVRVAPEKFREFAGFPHDEERRGVKDRRIHSTENTEEQNDDEMADRYTTEED